MHLLTSKKGARRQVGLQNLMEAHMGMHLPEMRRLARGEGCLTSGCSSLAGAHMPPLGFYLLKNPQLVTCV